MGFWSGLLKGLGAAGAAAAVPFSGGASLTALPSILGIAGAGLAGASQGAASNRGNKFEGQLGLQSLLMQRDQQNFQNSIAREQEGRAGATDAWRKLLSAQHTLSPAAMPNITPYAAAQRMPTDAERTGADALTAEVLKRLQGGNPIAPFQQSPNGVDPSLLDPGLFERIAGYASPVLTGLSALQQRPPLVMSAKQPSIQRLAMSGTPQNIGRG